MWTGDNLNIMRGMNSESVDLIYLDPPFNSNEDYSAPVGSETAGAAFKDTWTLSDVDKAWHGEIADKEPALYAIIDAAGLSHGQSLKSYLIMMAVRLLEMRRLLKPTGSLYLHCDPTAGHYLKMTLDCVFGRASFRNALIWRRTNAKGLAFCVAAEKRERQWVGIDLSPVAASLVKTRIQNEMGLFFELNHRTDIPRRTDLGKLPSYKTHKHQLFGKQEGVCAGCRVTFPFRNRTIDHIVPQSKGGTDHLDNLQLLCGACNNLKGSRDQARFLADLKARGIVSQIGE